MCLCRPTESERSISKTSRKRKRTSNSPKQRHVILRQPNWLKEIAEKWRQVSQESPVNKHCGPTLASEARVLPAQAGAAQQASPTVHKGRSVWSRAQGQEAGLSLWAHGDAATPHRVRPRMGELSQCVSLPRKRSSATEHPPLVKWY